MAEFKSSEEDLVSRIGSSRLSPQMRAKVEASAEFKALLNQLGDAARAAMDDAPATAEEQDVISRAWQRMAPQLAAIKAGEAAPLRLAAHTGVSGAKQAFIEALFVDPVSNRGHIRPVYVAYEPANQLTVNARVSCDGVMLAAADRAVRSAVDSLRLLGIPLESGGKGQYTWWIEGPPARYEGASLGLAIAMAAVGATLGRSVPPSVAVSGAVDGNHVGPVAGIAEKWAAIAKLSTVKTLIVPSAVLHRLPPEARSDPRVRLIAPSRVDEAVADLFGDQLGIAGARLAAATADVQSEMRLEVYVQPADPNVEIVTEDEQKKMTTRHVRINPTRTLNQYFIKDTIRVNVRSDRPCHVVLFNIGTSGNVTLLLPNEFQPSTAIQPGDVLSFPPVNGSFEFALDGPAGTEQLLAVATDAPIPFEAGKIGEVPASQIDTWIATNVNRVLARAETSFTVVAPSESVHKGVDPAEQGSTRSALRERAPSTSSVEAAEQAYALEF